MSGANRQRFAELDALRAFAVTLVVWSHAVGGDVGVGTVAVGGYHGVTLFFVISGFLITGILLDAGDAARRRAASPAFALRAFYARRFLRIFPVYYAVLALTFALGFDAVRAELGWHLAYLSNWYFAARGSFGISTAHLWSLAVEEQFYLVWPWFALLAPPAVLPWGIGAMILAGPLSRAALAATDANELAVWITTPAVLDALGLGCLLAWARRRPPLADRVAGTALAAAASLLVFRQLAPPLAATGAMHAATNVLPWALFCLWLVHRASAGFPGAIGRRLRAPWLVFVGTVSYGIYLFHLFVMTALPRVEDALGLDALALGDPGWPRFVVVMTISVAAAALSWLFFENPINSLKDRFPYEPLSRRASP